MTKCLKKYLANDFDGSSLKKLWNLQYYQMASSKVKEVTVLCSFLTVSLSLQIFRTSLLIDHFNQGISQTILKMYGRE